MNPNSTSPLRTRRFGSTGTSITRPVTRGITCTTYFTTWTSSADGAYTFSSRISATEGDDRNRDDDHRGRHRPGQPLELEEDQPDEEGVDREQENFDLSARPALVESPRDPARAARAALDRAPEGRRGRRRTPSCATPALRSPTARRAAEQAAEHQREQTQRLDRLRLRMVAALGDLFREDVHHPEEVDQQRRHEDRERRSPCSRQGCRRIPRNASASLRQGRVFPIMPRRWPQTRSGARAGPRAPPAPARTRRRAWRHSRARRLPTPRRRTPAPRAR